jgi:DUF4097 and DUF4098 domain-containing protein YvlB
MRPRGSITGPLIIILIGVVFLLHAISPDFPLIDWIATYWPYLLIVWGTIALLEVTFRAFVQRPIPHNGVSGGGWFVVVLICLVGFTFFQVRRHSDTWWENTDWGRGFDNAFGNEHEYSLNVTQKNVGATPHIIIENFRGDAKVAGIDGASLTVSGHKTVRALKDALADQTDAATPVNVAVNGNNVVIRCNQNHALYRTSVTTNLDLSVPRGASVEINGSSGDVDIASITGDLSLHSGNAGMRLQDIGGNIIVETRRSDLIRCTNVKGNIDVRGHGSDLELNRIAGQVVINGEYTGTLSLRSLNNVLHLQNIHTDLQVERIPGEIRLDRGSLNIQDAVGPLRVNAHSTDLSLEGVSSAMDISVDRGDLDLKPGKLPLAKITAHTGSGNIDLALPLAASFALTATTDSGQVENDFGDSLKEQTSGRGARLEGSAGSGPSVDLVTGRGTITVRKASEPTQTTVASVVR